MLPPREELDDLWGRCSPGYDCCVTRDSAYLSWRYAGHPLAKYSFIEARLDGKLEGLAVFRAGSERATLVDYVGPRDSQTLKRSLVRAFRDACPQAATFECTTTDQGLRDALARSGFLLGGTGRLRFFVRTTAPDTNVPSAGWFLMGGDSDGEMLAAAAMLRGRLESGR